MLPLTKILIVDDEDTFARNLQSFLARKSPDVRIAADSHSTSKILESFTPDIVVLDFGLPGMDGLQTYAVIVRHHAPEANCIMISGHLNEDLTRSANDQGIKHVLCKPFSFAELQEMIDLSLGETDKSEPQVMLNENIHAVQHGKGSGYPTHRNEDRRILTNRRCVNRRIAHDRRRSDVLFA